MCYNASLSTSLVNDVCAHVLQRRNPPASWLQYMRKDNVDGDDVMVLGLALFFDISVRVIYLEARVMSMDERADGSSR
eukprot:1330986-Pleurochrysis_carterae.AAC.2